MFRSVNHLNSGKISLTTPAPFGQGCSWSTVVIGPVIHLWRLLQVVGWVDYAYRAAVENVGIDH